MLRLVKDALLVIEVPSLRVDLVLDLSASPVKLLVPSLQHLHAGVDVCDCHIWLLFENGLNVNLVADFLANFVGDGLENELKLVHVLVNVPRDRPDQLQTVQQ